MTSTRIVPAADTTLVVGPGQYGEGKHLLKAGQEVPLEFEAAYLAQEGQSQVDDETVEHDPLHETVKGHGLAHSGHQVHGGVAENFDPYE